MSVEIANKPSCLKTLFPLKVLQIIVHKIVYSSGILLMPSGAIFLETFPELER